MSGDRYSQAIKEAYASCPSNEVQLDTLELIHPAFLDDLGSPTAIRVVRNYADTQTWLNLDAAAVQPVLDALPPDQLELVGLVARLEDSAPLDAGSLVSWTALAFELDRPPVDETPVPEITVKLDNVSREISRYLTDAATSNDYVTCRYRPYLMSTALDGPEMDPPLVFVLTEIQVSTVISAKGRLEDAAARNFPNENYTTAKFPGLIR